MSKKTLTLVGIYAAALILVLGIYSAVCRSRLTEYRRISSYSSALAFEETVHAVDQMSEVLRTGAYATDGPMCGKICSQVCAQAMAAEAAMATLPFATQELEELSTFFNQIADYAYTLCSQAVQEGFSQEQREKLTELAEIADGLQQSLRELQRSVYEGTVRMDSREAELVNVGVDNSIGLLSREFIRFEEEFPSRSALRYDGKYSQQEAEESVDSRSDAELLAMAARFAGVSPGEMRLNYEYEGTEGRKCYSAGDLLLCVDGQGVESLSQHRLVGESRISMEKAERIAKDYLEKQGLPRLQLQKSQQDGGLARFQFALVQENILFEDRCLAVTVALDDGSIYSFRRGKFSDRPAELHWEIGEAEAKHALPDGLQVKECKQVVVSSEGGNEIACYRFLCENEQGLPVCVYVDAGSGLQNRIIV